MGKPSSQTPNEEIRQIRQEKAMAVKRLERFKQTIGQIKNKNQALLKSMGLNSFDALEKMIMAQGVHPGGVDLFRKALAEQGKKVPEFLNRIPVQKDGVTASNVDVSPKTALKAKGKRVKFKL